LLDKKNILEIIKNYEPTFINSDIIVYEMMDNNSELLGARKSNAVHITRITRTGKGFPVLQ